ncbi:hypothetical protein LAZ67_18000695 [Cordylochernes scorpioides]|uniref:Uncharacterized protein n=1 Tax=Cordylochernes scorpioides TaxID=51811 RepID=A0ABY6LJY6_9ARAC|nr:hypothetical protein LAZ67_18000695 [Cordylochernes scorpioides]
MVSAQAALRMEHQSQYQRFVHSRSPDKGEATDVWGNIFSHKDLETCSHVFIRKDFVKRALFPPYEGSFPVVSRSSKTFTVKINDQDKKTHLKVSTIVQFCQLCPTVLRKLHRRQVATPLAMDATYVFDFKTSLGGGVMWWIQNRSKVELASQDANNDFTLGQFDFVVFDVVGWRSEHIALVLKLLPDIVQQEADGFAQPANLGVAKNRRHLTYLRKFGLIYRFLGFSRSHWDLNIFGRSGTACTTLTRANSPKRVPLNDVLQSKNLMVRICLF